MKKLFVGILMACLMVGFDGCASSPIKEGKIYTSYNIWIDKNMKCMNYKGSKEFIPVGTELKYVRHIISEGGNDYIRIKLQNKESYKIFFTNRWHPGKSIKDYINHLQTGKTFNEMVDGMSELEIKAIKQGKLLVGMSKEAVLLSYGIPAEHRTPNLEINKWRYWISKRKQKMIYFFDNKTATRSEYERLNSELEIRNVKEL